MKILVCVKQVPNSNNVSIDPETGVLLRSGTENKMNPYDLFAIEAALQIREKVGGSVSVLSMGPLQAKAVLLEALAMGADQAILLSDRKFAGADVVATSYTLTQGIKCLGYFDLIICGKQTTDGDTAQVGAEVAEFMDLPHAANVSMIEKVEDDCLVIHVNLDHMIQQQKISLPCLIMVEKDVNTPRLPSYKIRRDLHENQVVVLSINDFQDTDQRHYGLSGSPTQVEKIFPPDHQTVKEIYQGTSFEQANQLVSILSSQKCLLNEVNIEP